MGLREAVFGEQPRARRVRVMLGALAVFGLALSLRLHGLERESMWLDEAYSYARASLPLSELIEDSMKRFHNPSYFVFLHYWLALGDDELWMRLPSAIAGALAALAVFTGGYVLGGGRGLHAGLAAGTLVAISPEHVYYGQEARMYAMLAFAASLALLGFCWLATHRSQACRPLWPFRRLWPDAPPPSRTTLLAWLACFAGTLGTLYLHNTGVVFLGPLGVAVVALMFACGRRWLRFLANASVVFGAALLLWVPYVLHSLFAQAEKLHETFWEVFPGLSRSLRIARQLYLLDAPANSMMGALVFGGALAGLVLLRRRAHLAATLVLLGVLGPAFMLLISLHTPIFGARLLIWAPLPIFLLVGLGVSALRHPAWTAGFCVLAAALASPRLAHGYEDLSKERWREVHAAILPRVGPDTLLVAATRQEYLPLQYYFERRVAPLTPIPMIESPKTTLRRITDKKLAKAQLKAAKHLLIVDRRHGERSRKLLKSLRKRYQRISTVYFDRIRVDELVHEKKGSGHPKKLQPLKAGNGKDGYAKVIGARRFR